MTSFSRRTFLAHSSLSLAAIHWDAYRRVLALPHRSKTPISAFLPDIIDASTLRTVALAGIDAARHAGADYADVRVADWRTLYMTMGELDPAPGSQISLDVGYGVRVRIGGAWSFAFGLIPTTDAIVRSARGAVDIARRVSQFGPPVEPLIPVPVVQGEWATPMHVDPFRVSPDDHAKILGAIKDAVHRVPYGSLDPGTGAHLQWETETRVFASSEGSLITQRLQRALPRVAVHGRGDGLNSISLPVPQFMPQSAGFEAVTGTALQEQVKATTEIAVQLARYPVRPAEPGRLPGVMDGLSVAALTAATLGPSLELERALGYYADSSGTSCLTPIESVLGQRIFSPTLTIMADRALPHLGAARWDDEGVETQTYPVIEQGRVLEYFATRETASALHNLRPSPPAPLRGAAVAWSAMTSPMGCAAQLTVSVGQEGQTFDTMIEQLDAGIVILGQQSISVDQQGRGGVLYTPNIFEVKHGKIVGRLSNADIQFTTKRLWNAVSAVGGVRTVQTSSRTRSRGETSAPATLPVTAPAIHFSEIEVVPRGSIV